MAVCSTQFENSLFLKKMLHCKVSCPIPYTHKKSKSKYKKLSPSFCGRSKSVSYTNQGGNCELNCVELGLTDQLHNLPPCRSACVPYFMLFGGQCQPKQSVFQHTTNSSFSPALESRLFAKQTMEFPTFTTWDLHIWLDIAGCFWEMLH